MAMEKFSYFLLPLLMVFAFILPSMISVEVIPCIPGSTCSRNLTCNVLCKLKGYKLGGFCQKYVGKKTGNCCCHPGFESQDSSISDDINVLIPN
ncbi:PREDICTED: putative defensin-like protein 88 [Camelina sativa]|uniref:Defensin-like protein 88 n=1 Tax=Camelina sativa TaxID=90675 RepID=A0ABM1QQX3_CAMSA|nr:PREDICTED: putative defensin-like protein 88 [Camelina sativa]